jgi:hypothetical protein
MRTSVPPNSNASASAPAGERGVCQNGGALARRQKIILDYLEQAEAKLTAFQANIAYITADLMCLVAYFREDLDQVRVMILDPKERLQWMCPVTEQVYKITKQIDAFTQTSMRLERERQRSHAKRKRPSTAANEEVSDVNIPSIASAANALLPAANHTLPSRASEENAL